MIYYEGPNVCIMTISTLYSSTVRTSKCHRTSCDSRICPISISDFSVLFYFYFCIVNTVQNKGKMYNGLFIPFPLPLWHASLFSGAPPFALLYVPLCCVIIHCILCCAVWTCLPFLDLSNQKQTKSMFKRSLNLGHVLCEVFAFLGSNSVT
jgi:hypothetical protein